MTAINNATSAILGSRISSAPKIEAKKQIQTAEQQKEVCSSTYSHCIRSSMLGHINYTAEKASVSISAEDLHHKIGVNCKLLEETTGEAANQWWLEEMNYDSPPYLPHSKVQHIELKEDTKFARVYDGEVSGMFGGWVMKASDIEGLTPDEIKDKFALPTKPVKVCDVTVPAGTKMRTGLCNPLEKWGKGGGVQFDLMGQRVGEFDNERDLPIG